jgi:hypothetical protein
MTDVLHAPLLYNLFIKIANMKKAIGAPIDKELRQFFKGQKSNRTCDY